MLPLPAGREVSPGGGAFRYARHRPERALLYQIVEEYYPAFVSHLAAEGTALPSYVQREFEEYLKCGRLEHGFLRIRCDSCHAYASDGGQGQDPCHTCYRHVQRHSDNSSILDYNHRYCCLRMSVGIESKMESARKTVLHLERLLEDVWIALDSPDDIGPRWGEYYRGDETSERFVCIDATSNVLHVRFIPPDSLTITYLPGWFYQTATIALGKLRFDHAFVSVLDLDAARPMRFSLDRINPIPDRLILALTPAPEDLANAFSAASSKKVSYTPLAFGYSLEPARAFGITKPPGARGADTIDAAENFRLLAGPSSLTHWSAMKLRIAAAPGVRFESGPLLSDSALATVRAAYQSSTSTVICDQALRFEFERHRTPATLPSLGARFSPVPTSEPDIAACAARMARVKATGGAQPVVIEQMRPDGVDLILMKPDLRRTPRGTPPGFLPEWFVRGATFADDALFAILKDILDTYRRWLGGVPESTPLPIRIRVDPMSAADRFVYRLDYLTKEGDVSTEPPRTVAAYEPCFRLTVIRTREVKVGLDMAIDNLGVVDVRSVVEYRERVAPFEDIPLSIDVDAPVDIVDLSDRPATLTDLLQLIWTIGEFIPHPAVQAMYDLADLGSLASYVLTGKNIYGERMSPFEVAATLGGLLLPEVAERGVKSLLRVSTRGDAPAARLREAVSAVAPADAAFAAVLARRAAE